MGHQKSGVVQPCQLHAVINVGQRNVRQAEVSQVWHAQVEGGACTQGQSARCRQAEAFQLARRGAM